MTELISLLIVLAFLGALDAGYLAWNSMKKKPLVCPINKDSCNIVIESKWSRIFYFKNEVFGLIFYIGVIVGAFLLFFNVGKIVKTILLIATGFSVLFSAFLIYLQARVIKEYCFYCLISSLLSLLIFLDVVLLYFRY